MIKEIKYGLFSTILFILVFLNFGNIVEAQQVETEGTIGFTGGFYEPIGKPEPSPQKKIVKISDTKKINTSLLPQTNTIERKALVFFGIIIILSALFITIYKKMKVGIY